MGRRPQPEIRQQLLAECTRHVLQHGLPAGSLRSLAETTGTSPRMLIYHFGTKDQLVRDALVEARRQQRDLFDGALRYRPDEPYPDTLARAWSTLAGADARRYVQLFSTVQHLPPTALPWPNFPTLAVHDWLPGIRAGLRADGFADPDALATLVLAVARGLLLDDRATGESHRTIAAYEAFITMLNQLRPDRHTARQR